MTTNSLERFLDSVRRIWAPLTSELVAGCRRHLEELLQAPATEPWLSTLHREASPYDELYRDPARGFLLLAHTEPAGLYRPPHDHGRGWVLYAIQQGEIEMGDYVRVDDEQRGARLVQRDSTVLRPGQVRLYLPGDVHDTRCVSGPALLLRFTERDLRKEEREEHRVTRYVERGGAWIPEAA